MQDATSLLQELLASPEVRSAVREHADELDETFMAVLSANMKEAQRRNSRAAFERMAVIYNEIMGMMQENMPPEMQLINELVSADYPEGTRALLKEHQAEITPEFIEMLDQIADDMVERGDPQSAATTKRLRDIKAQAALLV